jgi:hypothetical protein
MFAHLLDYIVDASAWGGCGDAHMRQHPWGRNAVKGSGLQQQYRGVFCRTYSTAVGESGNVSLWGHSLRLKSGC